MLLRGRTLSPAALSKEKMKTYTKLLLSAVVVGMLATGCRTVRQNSGIEMRLVPGDLTTIEATDTIGGSRTVINSNDYLLAEALAAVTGTNVISLASNQTWTATNTFHSIIVTNLSGPGTDNFYKIDSSNTAAAGTTNIFKHIEADTGTVSRIELTSFFIDESAAALADVPGKGQIWVTNSIPNQLVFVADDGTETVLGAGGGGGGGTTQDANLTIQATDHGTVANTRQLGTNSVDLVTSRANGGSGTLSQVCRGRYCGILSGESHRIVEGVDHSSILSGESNDISASGVEYSVICGGFNQGIDAEGDGHFIGGGSGNTINSAGNQQVLVGGSGNTISGGTIDVIVGGSANSITAGSHSFIGGGTGNNKTASGGSDVICGGQDNDIEVTGGWSFIGGGTLHTIEGPYNVVVGGNNNFIGDNRDPGRSKQCTGHRVRRSQRDPRRSQQHILRCWCWYLIQYAMGERRGPDSQQHNRLNRVWVRREGWPRGVLRFCRQQHSRLCFGES
jgi:hypothetical protein